MKILWRLKYCLMNVGGFWKQSDDAYLDKIFVEDVIKFSDYANAVTLKNDGKTLAELDRSRVMSYKPDKKETFDIEQGHS